MANPTTLRIGQASTTTVRKAERYLVQFTVPALSGGASAESTVTLSGLSTNDCMFFTPRLTLNSTVTGVVAYPRCSTANELVLTISNHSQSSLSGSTQSGYLLVMSF